ncbi:MAG: GTP-binding protein [Planctomycetes bacterium]|nr:GTP-binding protein [Planctomycetota bacterium]
MDEVERKIVVVGDGGVGKTVWLKKIVTDAFCVRHVATLGVNVSTIHVPPTLNVAAPHISGVAIGLWDCAGVKEFSGRGDHSYIEADGAIVMFDLSDDRSYESCGAWVDKVREMAGDIPIVLCGNKCDMEGMDIGAIALHREKELTAYYSVSAKNNYNILKPIDALVDALGH